MNEINTKVEVKDLLSLKEFLRTGLGGVAASMVPFVVREDMDPDRTHYTFIIHQIHTVFDFTTSEKSGTSEEADELFSELHIPIIGGSVERVS